MRLLSIIFLFLINHAQAEITLGRPLMYERMIDQTMKEPQPQHLCHNFEKVKTTNIKSTSTPKINTDYFNATIQCSYECANKEKKSVEIRKEFRPINLSLFEGDGSSNEKILWRSLGVTIRIWAKEQCYKKAKAQCKNQVESISANKVSSGNWSWDTKLNCAQNKIVYSPFDTRFQLANTGQSKYQAFSSNPFTPTIAPKKPTNELQEFINNESPEDLYKMMDIKKCKKKIKVHTCFGDCVWENTGKTQNWSETLSTTEYLGTNDFSICANHFLEQVETNKYSRDIKTFKCEKYVWEFMRKTEAMGSSCAALRVETNCDEI